MNCRSEAERIAKQILWFRMRGISDDKPDESCEEMLDFLLWVYADLPVMKIKNGSQLFRLFKMQEAVIFN
jgi:hypothetical protein